MSLTIWPFDTLGSMERIAVSCGWRVVNPHSIISDFDAWFEHAMRTALLEVEADKVVVIGTAS